MVYLCKLVTAEAGYQSAAAQQNVICVVLNRVADDKFPNSIVEVIYQNGQFSCVANGGINAVEITDFTKENVLKAYKEYYLGGYNAQGAKFFTRGTFNRKFLFSDEVEHNFYL